MYDHPAEEYWTKDFGIFSLTNPDAIWKYHSTYAYYEVGFLAWSTFNLMFAVASSATDGASGRTVGEAKKYKYLWITCIIYALVTELAMTHIPNTQQAWHAQGVFMIFRTQSIASFTIYSNFVFSAYVITENLGFLWYLHAFPATLLHVATNFIYDLTASRYVWYTWHDTDPFIKTRILGQPLVNFAFQAGSSFFLIFFLNLTWRWCKKNNRNHNAKYLCILLPGILAFPATVIFQIIPFHLMFTDVLKVNETYGWLMLISIYFVMTSIGYTRGVTPVQYELTSSTRQKQYPVLCFAAMSLAIFYFIDPRSQISFGNHETIGDCEPTIKVMSAMGHVHERRQYLCLSDMREDRMYSHNCGKYQKTADLKNKTLQWYGVCGRDNVNPYYSHTLALSCCLLVSMLAMTAVGRNFKRRTE